MTQQERLHYLLEGLVAEYKEKYKEHIDIPVNEEEQFTLFRALCNIRPAGAMPAEWMKIQGIDYNALPDSEEVIEEEEWAKVSKASESNPIYWVRWREGRKILIYISEFVYKYSV